jgi:hypothetical protein
MSQVQKMPAALVASGSSIQTLMGLEVGEMKTDAGAAEVVRRWNAFNGLVNAIQVLEKAGLNQGKDRAAFNAEAWSIARGALKLAGVS